MVYERAEIPIAEGREADFEALLPQVRELIAGAAGAGAATIARGVERPSTYLLLIEWESVEAHMAWRETDGMNTFRTLVGPLLDGAPGHEHFAPV